jgi:hypothetical protein
MAGSRGDVSTERRAAVRQLAPLLGLGLFLLLLLSLAAPATAAAPMLRADSTPVTTPSVTPTTTPPPSTLTIQTPAAAEGPVGTYVTVAATGLTGGDTYQLGYALMELGCASGEQDLAPKLTAPALADGTLTQTFVWPRYLQSIGTAYFICLKDTTNTTNPNVQSAQQFKVDAAQAPQITLTPGPGPGGSTPTAGTTTFVAGGQAMLTGQSFLPGSQPLKALLLKKQYQNPVDLMSSSVVQLPPADGTTMIIADGSGNVTATLVLPSSLANGTYWVYLVSSDGSDKTPPSLLAGQKITVMKPAATPTPTASSTATPHATATPSLSPKRLAAIVGLGGLSLLLLIFGVVFLVSAAALPRPQR